jgi:hypothetical protein
MPASKADLGPWRKPVLKFRSFVEAEGFADARRAVSLQTTFYAVLIPHERLGVVKGEPLGGVEA